LLKLIQPTFTHQEDPVDKHELVPEVAEEGDPLQPLRELKQVIFTFFIKHFHK